MCEALPSNPQPFCSGEWERGLPLPPEFTAAMTPSRCPRRRSPSWWGLGLPAGGWVLALGSRLQLYPVPLPLREPWGPSLRCVPMGLSVGGRSAMGVCCHPLFPTQAKLFLSCLLAQPGTTLLPPRWRCPTSPRQACSTLLPTPCQLCPWVVPPCRSPHASLHLHLDGLQPQQGLKPGSVHLLRLCRHETKPEFRCHIPGVHCALL